jgi:DNA-binding NarL/FixJ family response regulator
MKILIVDDDPIVRIGVRSIFRKRDEIVELGTCTEALDVVCDVAVIDLMIRKDITGAELAKYLKHNNPNCIVIIYTAMIAGDDFKAANMVADAVELKTEFNVSQLKDVINAAITRGAK